MFQASVKSLLSNHCFSFYISFFFPLNNSVGLEETDIDFGDQYWLLNLDIEPDINFETMRNKILTPWCLEVKFKVLTSWFSGFLYQCWFISSRTKYIEE